MTIHCAACGVPIEMAPSTIAQRKRPERITCSLACKNRIRQHPTLGWSGNPNTRIEKSCEQCGVAMLVKRCLLARKRFCSRACMGRALVASKCNRPDRVYTANSGSFTAERSRGTNSPTWKEPICFTCVQCKTPFGLKPYEVKRRTLHCGYAPRFCSRACHMAHRRAHHGRKSQYWRGGSANYRGPGWRVIRLAIITAQGGRCAGCGVVVGNQLHVHHKRRFAEHDTPSDANRPSNLIGLCRSCHGKADGRPDAFRRFNEARRRHR